MHRSDLCVVILTQNDALSDHAAREAVLRSFNDPNNTPDVFIIRHAKTDRVKKLNAWFDQSFDRADRFIVLDADQAALDVSPALIEYIGKQTAAIALCCEPVPKHKALNAHRKRYAQYLCEQSAVLFFSPKAVKRMQTADTTYLAQEALADDSLSVAIIPKAICGVNTRSKASKNLRLMRCIVDLRRTLIICAAAAISASVVFLLCFLLLRSMIGLIGCIVSVHLFLFSLAALLILWYRRSAKHEPTKRDHLYVEESLTK